ncbi:hypothetical protein CSKR_108026, partial [Clonorchis sinensis]
MFSREKFQLCSFQNGVINKLSETWETCFFVLVFILRDYFIDENGIVLLLEVYGPVCCGLKPVRICYRFAHIPSLWWSALMLLVCCTDMRMQASYGDLNMPLVVYLSLLVYHSLLSLREQLVLTSHTAESSPLSHFVPSGLAKLSNSRSNRSKIPNRDFVNLLGMKIKFIDPRGNAVMLPGLANGDEKPWSKGHRYIDNALLIRLLKILRQPTTGFAHLGAHQ